MSTLTDSRKAVADALTSAGIKAFAYAPDQISPPMAIVLPADPYIEQGPRFGNMTVRFVVTAVTRRAANHKAIEDLDTLIELVVDTLEDWDVETVSAGSFELNPETMATQFTISKEITW